MYRSPTSRRSTAHWPLFLASFGVVLCIGLLLMAVGFAISRAIGNPALSAAATTSIPTHTPTASPSPTHTRTATPTPTHVYPTVTPSATPTVCTPPETWEAYTVRHGDTLYGIATAGGVSVDRLIAANCLQSDVIVVGQELLVPPGTAPSAPQSASSGPSGPVGDGPITIQLRPGWRLEQVAAAIDRTPGLSFSGAEFLALVGPGAAGSAGRAFLNSCPPGASLEGYMFPAVYHLSSDTNALQFREMVLDNFERNVTPQMIADSAAQGLTFHQIITLASIIRRESTYPDDQRLVASVFYNRLRSGRKLDAYVTVQYVLGTPANWWPPLSAADLNVNSPYNTHIHTGLPPGPIASPGLPAINAALYPAQTNYLFFTGACDGSGRNVFASTYEEFVAIQCR